MPRIASATVEGSKANKPQRDLFLVVMNHEEQYSIWPDSRAVPAGWELVGGPAPKRECLTRIEELWTDMRPLSVRTHIAATAETRDSH